MTIRTNAQLAGVTFLAYIVTGMAQLALFSGATSGSAADAIAFIAGHPVKARVNEVLSLVTCFEAIILGVTLHALTRDEDRDLAAIGLACRVAEGVINAMSAVIGLMLIRAITVPDSPQSHGALGALLVSGTPVVSATCFAVGSSVFAWLFLRAGSIPRWMAQLGVFASVLLVVLLPVSALRLLNDIVANAIWMPMLAFELVFAWWLIARFAARPTA